MSVSTIVILVLLAMLVLYVISIYNALVRLRNNMEEAWANISLSLKQRHDELTKLVDVCKQYMTYEQETLTKITALRQSADAALDKGDVKELAVMEGQISGSFGQLFALAENYPDLKANDTFGDVTNRIATLEGQITDRREFYNDSVRLLNTRIQSFPDLLFAGPFGFRQTDLLEFTGPDTQDLDMKQLFGR